MSELKFWIKVIGGSMLVGGLIFFSVMKMAIRGGKVDVPSVVDQPRASAEYKLRKVGLEMTVLEERFSTSAPFGSIISQDLDAGVTVKRGREIGVIVSKGTRIVAVPDLVGMRSSRQARLLLEQNGLVPGYMDEIHHASARDSVVAQSPEAGLQVNRGSRVSLLISSDPQKHAWVMPDLKGVDLHDTRDMLRAMGLVIRDVAMVKAEAAEPGTVLYQSISGGARVEQGQAVKLGVVDSESMRARYARLEYQVPDDGVTERRVQVTIIDARGQRVVHNAMEKPGALVKVEGKAWGRASYQVSLSGDLLFEKEIPE